jgi:3-deoxy-D-manno-octulosonate 8-phosphate phosphatase KdsC-like HAD superfamily phosphatase
VAFRVAESSAANAALELTLRQHGLSTTRNNLWILGWLGAFDKLKMARRVLATAYDLDIDADGDAVLYVGDSANDAPMFSFFRHTAGVSTVRAHLADLPAPPAWITSGPGGEGFVQVADFLLADRTGR